MEYAKFDPDKLEIGTVLNFGDGDISTVIGFTETDYKVSTSYNRIPHRERLVILRDKDGKDNSFYPRVCQWATVETMDLSIRKCRYCGALRPANEMKRETIWENRARRTDNYCIDRPCAGYAQMAALG